MVKKGEKGKKDIKTPVKRNANKWPDANGFINLQAQDDEGHWSSIGGMSMYSENPSGDTSKDGLYTEQAALLEAGRDVFAKLFAAGRIRANMHVLGEAKKERGGYSIPAEQEEKIAS